MPRTADAQRLWSIPSGSAIASILRRNAAAIAATQQPIHNDAAAGRDFDERVDTERENSTSVSPEAGLAWPVMKSDAAVPSGVFVHAQALCESPHVGSGTRVWAFAHILPGAVIGTD